MWLGQVNDPHIRLNAKVIASCQFGVVSSKNVIIQSIWQTIPLSYARILTLFKQVIEE